MLAKSEKPPQKVPWPKWTQLAKKDLKLMLTQLSCNPEDQKGIEPKNWSVQPVLPFDKEQAELWDQHFWLGWCLLSWCWSKNKLPSFDKLGVDCLDPILSKMVAEAGEPAEVEHL